MQDAIDAPEVSQRYALLTQLLLKAVVPTADARVLKAQEGAPSGRSLAKNVVVGFEQKHGSPLGGSEDPYVSNPLRRGRLDEAVMEDSANPAVWQAIITVLEAAEGSEAVADAALVHALAAMRERAHTIRSVLERGLELQVELLQAGLSVESAAEERRELLERVAPGVIWHLVDDPLEVEGSVGVGTPAEVPWIRVYAPDHAPSAQSGWYLAYLFAADGSAVYLSLLQGVTHGQSLESAAEAVTERFADLEGFEREIDLRSAQASLSARPRLYERATALAKRYANETLPSEADLEEDLAQMCGMLQEVYEDVGPPPGGSADIHALTSDAVLAELAADKIELPTQLVRAAVAALIAEQHVLLTGPPGTGKTSLAVALAKAAASLRVSAGFDTVTATADWTSAETIGGYWPDPDGVTLRFRAGHVLAAIDTERWVIIDELNRADIDKAFGPLFTVLSGQVVQLPQLEEVGGELVPVEIAPDEESAGAAPSAHRVPKGWRMLATLNTRDRDLLFNLSYALLRRFAIIDVPVPDPEQYASILAARAETGSEDLNGRLQRVARLPHRPLGPAILIDCGKYLRERVVLEQPAALDSAGLMSEALTAFVLPQLDDLTRGQQADIVRYLQKHVLSGWTLDEVRASLVTAFDLPASALIVQDEPTNGEAEGVDESGSG